MKNFNQEKINKIKKLEWLWHLFMPIAKPFLVKKSKASPRVLIVELHLIGDIVTLIPFLDEVARIYNGKNIYVLCGTFAVHIVSSKYNLIHYDAPWIYKSSNSNIFRNMLIFIKTIFILRDLNFEVGIDLRGDVRNILILFLSGCRFRIGYSFGGGKALLTNIISDSPNLISIQDHHLKILNYLGANLTSYPKSTIDIRKANKINLDYEYIGIHFGASQAIRLLPQDEALKVFNKILKLNSDKNIILFDSKDSISVNNFIIENCNRHDKRRIERWKGNLVQFINMLAECKKLYCMDSGPAHIAAALDINAIVLYGPNIPEKVRPLGDNVFCTQSDIQISCRPCNGDECTNSTIKACYSDINLSITN